MRYLIIFIILVAVVAGGYFFLARNYNSSKQNTQNENVSCTTGINGNSGDNYCSNYHTSSSRCLPRSEDTYPDGCTI